MQQDNIEGKACNLGPKPIETPTTEGTRRSKRLRRMSPLSRVMGRIPLRKILMELFLALSILFHMALMEGIYLFCRTGEKKKMEVKTSPMVFKIQPIKEDSQKKQPMRTQAKSKPKAPKADPGKKSEKSPIRPLAARRLEAIGKAHMEMVKEGLFPPLILSYPDPSAFVQQMYGLGAKTVVYDTFRREYYAMNLFSGKFIPMGSNDFKAYSFIKRVIRDPDFDDQKARAAERLNSPAEALQIVLLLPVSIEQRWIGHQVAAFSQMNLSISDVETVEARFQKGKLKLFRIHLKDGTTKSVDDPGCA